MLPSVSNRRKRYAGECPGPKTGRLAFILVLELENEMSSVSQWPLALFILRELKMPGAIHLALCRGHLSFEGPVLPLTIKGAQSNWLR